MESKTLSEKLKRHGSKCETNILMVKKEVLVGHCLGGIQVVGIQRGKELILWHRGSGLGHRDDSYLQNRRLANFGLGGDASESGLCRLIDIDTELTA